MAQPKNKEPQQPQQEAGSSMPEMLSNAQLDEALRTIQVQTRAFAQMNQAITAFFQLKGQVDGLVRYRTELEDKVKAHEETLAQSKDRQLATLARYQAERVEKEAEEKARFDQFKKEIYAEGDKLTAAISELKGRLAGMNDLHEKKQKETDEHIQSMQDMVEKRAVETAKEIEQIEAPLAAKRAELAELQETINGLLRRHGLAPAEDQPDA